MLEFGLEAAGVFRAFVEAEHSEGAGELVCGAFGFGALGVGEEAGVGRGCGGVQLGKTLLDERLTALPEIRNKL